MKTNDLKSKFWTFLGGLLKFEAPLWNWRQRLDYDYDFEAFRDIYLQPTDKTASLIICPKNCDYSCGFRKIKENEDGSFRAVCHKKKKDWFSIEYKELLLYKVNYAVLLPKIAQVLGIQPQIAPYQTWEEAWKMGTLSIGNRTLPVFFTLRNWNHKIISLILDLNRMGSGPYILLVTSSEVISPTSIKALEDSGSLFIPINEILDFNKNAEPILMRPLDSYFENMPGFLPHVEPESENIFRKCGDAWEIRFHGGEKFMLTTGNTGASYLHFMLARPNVATPVTEIMRCVSGESEDYVSPDRLDEEDISSGFAISDLHSGQSDAIADETALRQYKEELNRLKKSIEEAEYVGDNATAELLKQEQEELRDEMKYILSNTGQMKNFTDQLKKLADACRGAISFTIDKTASHDLELAEYLKITIRTGRNPGYFPSDKRDWVL